ncbi:hypothetical protein L7F22_025021 [Adiantum nelumboides]|nr:hypothetical protein [Adiantum nelumboides]
MVSQNALELSEKSYVLPPSSNASRMVIQLADGCSEGPHYSFTYSKALKTQRGSFEHPSASRMVNRLALELASKSYGLAASSNAKRMVIRLADDDRALHCQRVEEGLQRLYQYGGQLNPNKCHVAEKEVVLLGHVISQEGIKVDPSHVQAILDLPPPNSARQVITFVQKVRYMSRFIHLLSQIISPLQQLANQEVFSWEQEHLECFNEVKEVLGSLPTIMSPDPQGIYYLCPSVGLDAFGAVLMQKDPKTAYMRPIYFTSKVMTQGQKGYTNIEQLIFSLIVAIRKFRSYLLPKPFIIFTLEHNLPYAIQHMSISSKISKWVLELQEYEYTFIVENNTRDSLADVLTYKVKEKKITPKAQGKLDFSPQGELEDAYTLLFDGAYRRQRNKATGGFVILNEEKKEVLKKGIQLHLAHSNNEADYATLKAGLEECKSMGIRRLMVKGDALLIVRQVQGTCACKNSKLLQWLHEVKLLMKDFEAIQIQHTFGNSACIRACQQVI